LYCEASIRAFEQIQAPKKLLVGPWMHTMPNESPFEAVDFLSMALNWWDRWLRDECSDAPTDEAPVTVYVQGRGVWLDLPAWPPTDTRCQRMSASADASLPDDTQPIGPGLLEQPVDATVGVQSGLWGMPTRGFGLPRDQHEDDAKSLAFTSTALDGPIEIRGHPVATVTARVEAGPERTLVVKLTHVAPDGRSTLITCGTGSLPAVAARDLADHDPAVTRATTIRMIPTAYDVPAGHRLRLTIAAGDFPRLWPIATEKLAVVCGRDDTCVRLHPTRLVRSR
jgi:hypothetical protein